MKKINRLFCMGLFWGVLLCATGAMAQDVLIGHVVSVNRDTGEFVLQVTDGKENSPKRIIVKKSANEKFLFLPGCVEPGNFVRIWGKISSENNTVFHADIVRGPGLENRDSSGIRSRINRGMARQYGRQNHRSHKKNN